MEHVLVIDDDPEVRTFLRDTLAQQSFAVAEAATAEQASAALGHGPDPMVILLDLGLPDRDGQALLLELRARTSRPIIVLSARDADDEKVMALDHGADDYLTKPCSTAELLARIRVALRHARGDTPEPSRIVVGPIAIDEARHEVLVDGSPVRLTPIEFRLLLQLARRSGKVLTHRQLLEAVWGAGKETQTHYLRVHMQALRRKIERDPSRPRWLATEPGIGYRLRDE